MHLKMDELLALRDGDASTDAARHVERCEACRAELEELRKIAVALKDLPSFALPGEAWPEIRDRIVWKRRRATKLRFAFVAASVLVAAAVTLVTRFGGFGDESTPPGITEPRVAVEHLSAASRELELVLQDPSLRSRVLSPQRAAVIVELEDRIALVDRALAENADQEPGARTVVLWSERVELLDALVAARGGEPREIVVTPAVIRNQGSLL